MKKILSFLVVVCILTSVYTPVAFAETLSSGKISADGYSDEYTGEWTLDDRGTLTISGTGELGEMYGTLDKEAVLSIVVDEGVEGLWSFDDYSKFPNLKKVNIISTVFKMRPGYDMNPFRGCPSLAEIIINPDNGNITVIDGVVYDKEVTKLVLYPDGKKDKKYVIPETVTEISAFRNANYIEEIVLHDNMKVFMYIDIPNLKSLNVPASVEALYVGYYENFALKENGVYYLGNDSNPYLWVAGCDDDLEKLEISDKSRKICNYAFGELENLKEAIIPDNIEYIGSTIFSHCARLEKITVGSGIDYLPGFFCYGDMPKLKTVYVSDNMRRVPHDAFWISGGMSNPSYDPETGNGGSHSLPAPLFDNLETPEKDSGMYYLGNKQNPHVVLFGYDYGFSRKTLELPDGLKSICAIGFKNITKAVFPESLEYISEDVFGMSENLTDVYYGGSKADWDKIHIGSGNEPLLKAEIHYTNNNFENIEFESAEYTYDGTQKLLSVSGNLPENATVSYKNEKAINAGIYKAEAVIEAEGYNTLTLSATLRINPAEITVKANDIQMIKNSTVPELTYTVINGELFGEDKLSGSLTTKANGSKIGDFDITKGTLDANSNYKLSFVGGTLSVVDKTPQKVEIGQIEEKTYGDEAFGLVVTPDEVSNLGVFTYASSDETVAEVSSEGIVTVKSSGKTIITVMQAGDDTYAPYTGTTELIVNPKKVTVLSVNPDEKTAGLEGVFDSDADVALDFENIRINKTNDIDENTIAVEVSGFALVGDKASNYTVITEVLESTVKTENTVETKGTVEANGSVLGSGLYLKGSNATLVAVSDSGYRFAGWYDGDTLVSTSAEYTFKAEEHPQLKATFKKKSIGRAPSSSGSSSGYTIKFDSMGGSAVASQSVKSGGTATAPADPAKDGYRFLGWYTDKELTVKYDFKSKVTKSVTLYAAWDVNAYADKIVLTIGKKEAIVFGEERINDVAPLIRNDRTMLPARFVAESLGADVAWDETAPGIVTITKDDVKMVIRIGEKIAEVNGEKVELDSPAFIENARTYTPIRFIAEELGATVEWNGETQEVTITVK